MTVSELIAALSAVKDKNLPVVTMIVDEDGPLAGQIFYRNATGLYQERVVPNPMYGKLVQPDDEAPDDCEWKHIPINANDMSNRIVVAEPEGARVVVRVV